jgi:SAM-dependent methyltransferase
MRIGEKSSRVRTFKTPKADFEDLYMAIRKREKRLYSDEQVSLLPDVDPSDMHYSEWKVRKRSCERLMVYLIKKRKFLRILEVGCGNGWLSAKLASMSNTRVTGLDNNQLNINQANRVFKKDNLEFVYDTFNDSSFEREKFDIIIFEASIKYFPSVVNTLKLALGLLNRGGEVHILDAPFYDPVAVSEADKKNRDYYAELGYPEMADYYYYHSVSELWGFKYRIMFNPDNIFNRLFNKDPYYWIAINK